MTTQHQLRRDPKRGARRQVDTINSFITSAQPRARATPKENIRIKGQGQTTNQVKNREQNSLPGRRAYLDSKEGVVSKARATPENSSNQISQLPLAMMSTPRPEPKSITGKRGRPEEFEQTQQRSKKARMQPLENHTAPEDEHKVLSPQTPPNKHLNEEEHKRPSAKKPLNSMSEEERKAERAKRFAPGAVTMKTKRFVPAKPRTPLSTTTATSKPLTKQDPENTVHAQTENFNKTLRENNNSTPNDKPAAIQEESRKSNKQFTSIVEGPKNTPATPTHLPSPSSSSQSSSSTKRDRAETDDSEEHTRKKQRLEPNQTRLPTLEQNNQDPPHETEIDRTSTSEPESSTTDQLQPESHMVHKSQGAYKIQRAAPVQANPDCKLKFFPYDNNSVPIMYSAFIKHTDMAELTEKPSLYLRQEALAILRRSWTFRDLGRKEVPKKIGPTRIIDDCDLYLRESKVYVATERGLLLVADYLRLLDVPDTQPVRFNGRKPTWAKAAEASFHHRRVERSYEPLTEKQKELGFISLYCGNTVIVYERIPAPPTADGKAVNLAYGTQLEDCFTGLFSYDHTCPMDWGMDDYVEPVPHPDVINWNTYDYTRLEAIYKATVLGTASSNFHNDDSSIAVHLFPK